MFFSVFFCPTTSGAVELGSCAPAFSLSNLEGNQVGLTPPSAGSILILYFFDASDQTVKILSQLKEGVSKNPGVLSLVAVSRTNPEMVKSLVQDKTLLTDILSDNKGITLSYGLSKTLPAAVVVGPGGMVASILPLAKNSREILNASADTLISIELPASAMKVYRSAPDGWLAGPGGALAIGYASILMRDSEGAHKALTPLLKGSSPSSPEAHAAMGFLLLRQGKDEGALAECSQVSGRGFADFVTAMVNVRAEECNTASALFNKATRGMFAFNWQKALAFNMAARAAEEKGDKEAASRLYRQAWEAAPLSPAINANLLMISWQQGNFPAAQAYAGIIKSSASQNPIIRSLVDEFESDSRFSSDQAAQKRLEKTIKDKLQQKPGSKKVGTDASRSFLVCDLAINHCLTDFNFLPLAGAGLLRQSLSNNVKLVPINRPEMAAAAKLQGIPSRELQNPLRLKKVANDLSADLLAFGEAGAYGTEYILNLRIADAKTGEIIAAASERFDSLDDMPFAIQRSAAALKQKMTGH